MTQNAAALAIGKRIRTKMQVHNLTVARAAELCSLPKPTIEEYLYGKSLPGAETLVALSRGLGCTTDWLLFGEVAK
jgi:transcriptional regulator with XRE-family HTH domain